MPCFIFQIEGPFWCPTKIKTPTGVYDFPLKSGDYYHTNSAGLQYEAAAVRKYIQEGICLQQIIPSLQQIFELNMIAEGVLLTKLVHNYLTIWSIYILKLHSL